MRLYFIRLGIAVSVLLNVIFTGYSNQTVSARNYDLKRRGLPNIVFMIDKIFFLQPEHCKISWSIWIALRMERDKWEKLKAENQRGLYQQE